MFSIRSVCSGTKQTRKRFKLRLIESLVKFDSKCFKYCKIGNSAYGHRILAVPLLYTIYYIEKCPLLWGCVEFADQILYNICVTTFLKHAQVVIGKTSTFMVILSLLK